MAIDGQTADKLRGFLRELTPRARAMLLAELERSEQRGQPMPGGDLIMRMMREADAAAASAPAPPPPPPPEPEPEPAPMVDRDGAPARFFFAFIEPFFVDDVP